MALKHPYSKTTLTAMQALGKLIVAGRRDRSWTQSDLAERVGTSRQTIAQVESGAPSVALGTVFEAAALTGVALFDRGPVRIDGPAHALEVAENRLALLPSRVRVTQPDIGDDF